jgi:hypothetical protein
VISVICAGLLAVAWFEHLRRPMTMNERLDAWQAERDVWGFRR